LAHVAACRIDWIDPNVLAMMTQWSYLHIHDEVLPNSREHGVTQSQIDSMLVEVPRRYFEHNTAY
jgi:phosphotriesterase-related protein